MTTLPDWLVERVALDEVPPHHRDRVARAAPDELAARVAAVRAADAAELAAHPAAAAVAALEARVAAARRQAPRPRAARWLALAGATCAAALVAVLVLHRDAPLGAGGATEPGDEPVEPTRAKGAARLLAFRQVDGRVERLAPDTLVQAGDHVQLRYHAGDARYGLVASLDGLGAVTLHSPDREDAPPEATALPTSSAALPHAYILDDAPRFEVFFFITSARPIDVQHSLAALRALAAHAEDPAAALALPEGQQQVALRLRKPLASPTKDPTP